MISKNNFYKYIIEKKYDLLKDHKVHNAVILAAGESKRFRPISEYCPKGLSYIKGEILIERQIKQLQAVGIADITVIVGYKKELFYYLTRKYNVSIIVNELYDKQDNLTSLKLASNKLSNTYICSVDNYYPLNPFNSHEYRGYYPTVHILNQTHEWIVKCDADGIINNVQIGGTSGNAMLGFVYFDQYFSDEFKRIIEETADYDIYNHRVWEFLYIQHLSRLKLEAKPFPHDRILEFDSVDDAMTYDPDFLLNNDESHFRIRHMNKEL